MTGRNAVRRALLAVVAASFALLLGACVGLPSGGPVSTEEIDTTVDEANLLSLPERPQAAVVRELLAAVVSLGRFGEHLHDDHGVEKRVEVRVF